MAHRRFTSSIQARLMLAVVVAVVLMAVGLGTAGWLAVRESMQRSLQERLALAEASAEHLGYVLSQNLSLLGQVAFAPGVDTTDGDNGPEKEALHDVFVTSIFDDGVYIADLSGKVLVAEPERPPGYEASALTTPPLREALLIGKPVISNAYSRPAGQMVISAVVPLKRGGATVGAVVGDIDPTGLTLSHALQPVRLGQTGYVEVVDYNGTVVASSRPQRLLETSDHGKILAGFIDRRETTSGTCHAGCHQDQGTTKDGRQTEVMAFAPLSLQSVSWGVTIRQSEAEAMAPSRNLLRGIILVSIPALLLSVVLAWGMAQSVSRPIISLTSAARKLSAGNLLSPIPSAGSDEVGTLGHALEDMRAKLSASLEEIKRWNLTLESKVGERTRELEALYQQLQAKESAREELLRKVITAQEEERKRLARDLHDDTSQALAAMVMALDTCIASPPRGDEQVRAKVEDIRAAAKKALDSVRQIMLDLRPSILDDLGLVPALRWYAEARLGERGVKVRLETNDYDKRLPSQLETTLFRIIQEAVTNIARHAEAENAVIAVDFQDSTVTVEVEDDGKGFDTGRARDAADRTFGLLGMQERVSLLGGEMRVDSHPGSGTRITVSIPLPPKEAHNV
ncbi:MAG: cache domain-containing protein [Chloroflexota bacterium]